MIATAGPHLVDFLIFIFGEWECKFIENYSVNAVVAVRFGIFSRAVNIPIVARFKM